MRLPPSISFPSSFMNFTSVQVLFGFLFNFINSFSASFLIELATTFFVRFLVCLYLALFSSDQFLHLRSIFAHLFISHFLLLYCFLHSSLHQHESPWFFLSFSFPHTSSQACSILFLKAFHKLGASTSTNSLTLS